MIILNGLNLGPHLQWIDEFDSYARVAQHRARTLAGISILQNQALSLGRPITLQSTENTGWITRDQVVQLVEFSKVANFDMQLDLGTQTVNVQFRHSEEPALEVSPLGDLYILDGVAEQYYLVTIKLITV